jgi:hypothetical protein
MMGYKQIREVLANRTATVIKTKTDKICLLIDVAISLDRNVIQKEAENQLKCKNTYKYRNPTNVECEMLHHTSNQCH